MRTHNIENIVWNQQSKIRTIDYVIRSLLHPNMLLSNFLLLPPSHSYRARLEMEAEELTKAGDTESERLMDIYERLEELDAATAETKAGRILHGLGR